MNITAKTNFSPLFDAFSKMQNLVKKYNLDVKVVFLTTLAFGDSRFERLTNKGEFVNAAYYNNMPYDSGLQDTDLEAGETITDVLSSLAAIDHVLKTYPHGRAYLDIGLYLPKGFIESHAHLGDDSLTDYISVQVR